MAIIEVGSVKGLTYTCRHCGPVEIALAPDPLFDRREHADLPELDDDSILDHERTHEPKAREMFRDISGTVSVVVPTAAKP